LLRQTRLVIEARCGEKLDNSELIQALCGLALEAPRANGKPQRPRHQVAVTVCKACKQGWQNGAGREVPISAVDVELALCDAQCMSLDGHAAKLTPTIPAATRRFVWRRDHGRCTVPGCRASCFIDVHHIVPRALGGSNDVTNLTLLCAGHHRALHDGLIVIEGPAPDFTVTRLTEVPHVGASQSVDAATTEVRRPEDLEPRAETSRSEVLHVGDCQTVETPASEVRRAKGSKPRVETPRSEVPHVGDRSARSVAEPTVSEEAELALVTLGFQRGESRRAVERARARVGEADLETLLRAALRECPRPAS
jgi:hypothetical protein